MLFSTVGQFGIFLAFVWLGAILGIIHNLLKPQNVITKNIFDVIIIVISGILFILFMQTYNLGQFRLYLVLGVVLGYIFEKKFIGKTLAQLNKLLYNNINKTLNNVSNTLKSKLKIKKDKQPKSKNNKRKNKIKKNKKTTNKIYEKQV